MSLGTYFCFQTFLVNNYDHLTFCAKDNGGDMMLDLFLLLEIETEVARTDASGYHFVPFSYGNSAESSDQKNLDVAPDTSVFHPTFSVPESLLQNLVS